MKLCKIEGCVYTVWGKGLCKFHQPHYSLSKGTGFKKKKKEPDVEGISKMREFFLSIWKQKPHVSEISGEKILFLSTSFHHILLKSKTPEAKYDPLNIILLTQQEHQQTHSDMYRYPEVNRRRELLLEKYGLK